MYIAQELRYAHHNVSSHEDSQSSNRKINQAVSGFNQFINEIAALIQSEAKAVVVPSERPLQRRSLKQLCILSIVGFPRLIGGFPRSPEDAPVQEGGVVDGVVDVSIFFVAVGLRVLL